MNKKTLLLIAATFALAAVPALAQAGCGSDHAAKRAEAEPNIVEIAQSGGFDTLVTAVKAAGLVDALAGDGPLTVFAPTDEAFANLPAGTLESLLENPEALKKVLLYHVVSGKVEAGDVVELASAETLLGQKVAIDTTDGVKVGGARVVKTDIEASNGVVHVIDTVLIPSGLE